MKKYISYLTEKKRSEKESKNFLHFNISIKYFDLILDLFLVFFFPKKF